MKLSELIEQYPEHNLMAVRNDVAKYYGQAMNTPYRLTKLDVIKSTELTDKDVKVWL